MAAGRVVQPARRQSLGGGGGPRRRLGGEGGGRGAAAAEAAVALAAVAAAAAAPPTTAAAGVAPAAHRVARQEDAQRGVGELGVPDGGGAPRATAATAVGLGHGGVEKDTGGGGGVRVGAAGGCQQR